MKFIISTIFILTLVLNGQGQIKNLQQVNKKTKQWIGLSSTGSGHNKYHLLSKTGDSCETRYIKVSYEYDKVFIDSLKKCGFSEKVKYLDKRKSYRASISLISCDFERMKNANDSLFKYTYKVTLTDLKTNTSKSLFSERLNTQKEKMLKAFILHDYSIQNITEIKGTSIIQVDIYSESIYNLDETLYVFSPSWSYFF